MSAALKEIPRKRGGGGQTSTDTLCDRAAATKTPRKRAGDDHKSFVTHVVSVVTRKTPRKRADGSQRCSVTHEQCAAIGKTADQCTLVTRLCNVRAGSARKGGVTPLAGHVSIDTRGSRVSHDGGLKTAVSLIVLRHREYRGIQQSRGDMDRRILSEARWIRIKQLQTDGKAVDPKKLPKPTAVDVARVKAIRPRYFQALEHLQGLEKGALAEVLEPTKLLPVVPWQTAQRGFGIASLAAIVAHAGDLADYSNPAKLWKRFSLHVVDGRASRRAKGDASQGFVPHRRAEMHVIGDTLLRAGGEYADLYRERKAFEIEKIELLGMKVRPAAKIPKKNADMFVSAKRIHMRALRYIEKRLLRELWRAWNPERGER